MKHNYSWHKHKLRILHTTHTHTHLHSSLIEREHKFMLTWIQLIFNYIFTFTTIIYYIYIYTTFTYILNNLIKCCLICCANHSYFLSSPNHTSRQLNFIPHPQNETLYKH